MTSSLQKAIQMTKLLPFLYLHTNMFPVYVEQWNKITSLVTLETRRAGWRLLNKLFCISWYLDFPTLQSCLWASLKYKDNTFVPRINNFIHNYSYSYIGCKRNNYILYMGNNRSISVTCKWSMTSLSRIHLNFFSVILRNILVECNNQAVVNLLDVLVYLFWIHE